MCECCESKRQEKEIFYDEENYWYIKKLCDGKFYMFYRHKDFLGARGVQIKNCPMCGRKLED